jgi:hypothetical protein
MLEHIEMPPGQHLRMVVTKDLAGILGTADRFPQTRRLPNLQKDRAALPFKATFDHLPVQSQTQQFMKQFLRCHPRSLPTANFYSTENSGEPAGGT